MAVAAGLGLALLAVVGWVLRWVAPAPPKAAELARLASELLVSAPKELRPEPAEHFVYVLLVLFSPLVVGVAAAVAARFRPAGAGRADGLFAALVVGAAWLIVGFDPISLHYRLTPAIFLSLGVAAAVLATVDLWSERRRFASPVAVAAGVLLAAAMVVMGSWRTATSLHGPQMHYEAFAYSVMASAQGRTCLVNLQAQYGCYGMVLGPLLHRVGATVSHLTLAAGTLSVIAVVSIGVFSGRAIRSPLLALGATLALAVMTLRWGRDIYLQYLPLRVLFPAISLPALLWWEARPSATRAAWLGLGAACAIFWNLDSGAPVAAALGLYIAASGGVVRAVLKRRLALILSYAGALIAMAAALICALALKGGAWPDLRSAIDYQRIFLNSGFYMLPMPAPPAAWVVCIALAAIALAWFAVRTVEGLPSRKADRAAFMAVLGVGLFSYYVGRSHVQVLAAASWPFVILAFLLLDAARSPSRVWTFLLRAGGVLTVAMLLAIAVQAMPKLAPKPLPRGVDTDGEDIAFVRDRTPPGAPLALIASKQAVILGELGRAPALPGPGWAETLTRKDADALFDFLVARGPHDVFVSDDLIFNTRALTDLSPWVALRLPRLNPVYDVVERGPGGRLLHFVRKPGTSPIPMASTLRSR